jgi:hypothetical protein
MKKEDLMIGDWVNIQTEKDGEPMYSQVEQLWECEIDADFQTDYENVYPIELTEEILHKNGFKNDVLAQKSIIAEGASNFSVILFSEDNRIKLDNIDEYLNSFNKWSVHIDTEDMRTMCTAEITYVHELQHLLKLCKIEKELIL